MSLEGLPSRSLLDGDPRQGGLVYLMRGMYSKLTPKFSRSAGSLTSFQKPGSSGVIKGKLPKITHAPTTNYAPAVSTLLGTEEERDNTQFNVFQEQQRDREERRNQAKQRILERQEAEKAGAGSSFINPKSITDGDERWKDYLQSVVVYKGSSEAPKHHTPIVVTATSTSHKAPSGVATAKATAVGKHSAPGSSSGTPLKSTTKASESLAPKDKIKYDKAMAGLKKVAKAKKKLEMNIKGGSGSDKVEIDGEGGFVGKGKGKGKGKTITTQPKATPTKGIKDKGE